MMVPSFGSLIKTPKMDAIWSLTVRFDSDGDHRTQVSAIGRLAPEVRSALGRWAAERGTIVFASGA